MSILLTVIRGSNSNYTSIRRFLSLNDISAFSKILSIFWVGRSTKLSGLYSGNLSAMVVYFFLMHNLCSNIIAFLLIREKNDFFTLDYLSFVDLNW